MKDKKSRLQNIVFLLAILSIASIPLTMIKYEYVIEELKEENNIKYEEIQELKQTLYMIEMRNEGIMYIEEI